MKKIFISIVLLFGASYFVKACPFCGCGNSNFQIGVLPTFSNAFAGVRYSYSTFNTDSGSQYSRDYFHTTEIWGGYKRGKFQVMAFIPYLSIHKRSDDGVVNSSGLGDITILGNYQLMSNAKPVSENGRYFAHTLWAGGGIKLKTGQSAVDVNDHCFSVGDFTGTPGTGSTDYLININDALLFGNHGIVTNIAYKINTQNNQHYRYGNQLYVNTAYFYSIALNNWTIRPSAGVNVMRNETNRYHGQEVQDSQGYTVSGMAGLNVQRKKIGLLLNGFLPVSQNLFNGFTRFNERTSVALTYSF
ncbi:MAG: hypothetical protein OJF59_001498 [Cytophagales bacterium]|jgi:hypothetical protein|nr:hypothetical protein [Bacteroidota bacterium]MBS1980430.1 hypothetical protein [Bacteroidota bacterium]WHZ07745.1 MAG: hypothetical protein OJF59_001498 [Cytophagales bacterium]